MHAQPISVESETSESMSSGEISVSINAGPRANELSLTDHLPQLLPTILPSIHHNNSRHHTGEKQEGKVKAEIKNNFWCFIRLLGGLAPGLVVGCC